jgi:hypothetical protein
MQFHFRCTCGHELEFAASFAGTLIPCLCGRQVKIPKLSELKRLSGQNADCPVMGIADHLRTMYLDKQLPPGTNCVICHMTTRDTLSCWVECERARASSAGALNGVLAMLFTVISPLHAMHTYSKSLQYEAVGNDLVVRTPLPICENCLHSTRRSESNIRKLLLGVDLYRELLEAYPGARVGAG